MMSDGRQRIAREHQRFDVSLDVKLDTPNGVVSATASSLSCGGAKIVMPFSVSLIDLRGLQTITLVSIGKLKASVVWMSQNELGLKFSEPSVANSLVTAYLKANGYV